ncbi:hypothetical protein [Streptomyces sp. VRA16 Mangrove soil]|uniref:hypothetical protein n=1 Tax=Streptomyces sp. VRA16 Mangrove soil TaxID=2817434 RepID=UPI001A9E2671|nr:hypothetical protein [Streptomyces sp. VRA16 Mangrove soil]MBO1332116.1 hypothetical protein [Streptomyces sp. VRA16 Mangrove soil]
MRRSSSRLAKPLVDSGLLVGVDGKGDSDSGTVRRTRPLDINPTARHFIGAKVTGADVHAVLTTMRAEVTASSRRPLTGRDPASVVATLRELADELSPDHVQVSGWG